MLDGVAADEALHTFFVDKIGTPDRVYVWGDSLGGLITETLAEKHPEWVSGAAPLCGVLGGGNLNLDLALDVAYAVKTLIYPDLKLTGFASHDEAVANWQGAYDAITKAGGGPDERRPGDPADRGPGGRADPDEDLRRRRPSSRRSGPGPSRS